MTASVHSLAPRTATRLRLIASHKAEDEIENIEIAIAEMGRRLGMLKTWPGDPTARIEMRKAARLVVLACDQIEEIAR